MSPTTSEVIWNSAMMSGIATPRAKMTKPSSNVPPVESTQSHRWMAFSGDSSSISPTERDTRSVASRDDIARLLVDARARTLRLVETVSEEDLHKQHDPLMGPILWDLGHIGAFEELWLDRNLEGKVEFVEMPGMYNPFEHPRRVRGELPLPTLAATLASMAEMRERVLERLERANFSSDDPLLRDGPSANGAIDAFARKR